MPLAPSTKLGPYEILSPLGAGGMGEVYLARDTRLGRDVAVKILPAHLSNDSALKQRFEREARTISKLNHPGICVLYDIGSQNGVDYLVMEYIEGETLAARLLRGPLPLDQVLKFGGQLADALEKAHRSGVVHRDLKPGNIMLAPSGAKLLDFGLAKPRFAQDIAATLSAGTLETSPVTQTGTIVGTFQYMSPEQVEGRELDARSDIFSLGAVLYEMLTGRRAFQGKSQLSVASAILEKEPEPISIAKPLTPPALDHAIRLCLAKSPDDRWQTARDLALHLKWIAEGGSQVGVPVSTVASPRRAYREWIAWGVAALAFAALAAGVAYVRRTARRPPIKIASILPPDGVDFASLDVDAGAPEISPDGAQIVFVGRGKSQDVMLWVRRLDSDAATPLAGTNDAGHPFWSPDSRFIAFFANGKLSKIAANGGPVQTICDSRNGRGGSWGNTGVILFTPETADVLYRVPADGGAPATASLLDSSHSETSHRWPQFLADGRHYLFYVRSDLGADFTGEYIGSLDSQQHRLVLPTALGARFVEPGYLLYTRNQTIVAQRFDARNFSLVGDPVDIAGNVALVGASSAAMFSASNNGALIYQTGGIGQGWDLAWYDRTGKRLSDVGVDSFLRPALSPNADQLAVVLASAHYEVLKLWLLDLKRGTKTLLTLGPAREDEPFFTPDGQSLIFTSNVNGGSHIYRRPLRAATPAEVLLDTPDIVEYPLSVCRDGRYLLYGRPPDANTKYADIWVLPLFGQPKAFPLVHSGFDHSSAAFSPDCNWVAYDGFESGQYEIYIVHFPDGSQKYQVSTDHGIRPRWSGDGKELFFYDPHARALMSASVATEGKSLALGAPKALFSTPAVSRMFGPFEAAPDGKRFLINGADSSQAASAPITLMLNWQTKLGE